MASRSIQVTFKDRHQALLEVHPLLRLQRVQGGIAQIAGALRQAGDQEGGEAWWPCSRGGTDGIFDTVCCQLLKISIYIYIT